MPKPPLDLLNLKRCVIDVEGTVIFFLNTGDNDTQN